MLPTAIRWAGTYLRLACQPEPEHWQRAIAIGPGREGRAGPKFELPKLQAGLPKLGTAIRWAGTYLTPQQRFSPDWTVTARGLRGKPIGPGRAVRVGPKLELPKLQGSLPMLRTGIRWPGTYLGCQQGPRPERRLKPHGARAKPIGPGR